MFVVIALVALAGFLFYRKRKRMQYDSFADDTDGVFEEKNKAAW